jgi:hypothetical protein
MLVGCGGQSAQGSVGPIEDWRAGGEPGVGEDLGDHESFGGILLEYILDQIAGFLKYA